MKISIQALRRPVVTAVAFTLGVSGALPALLSSTTYAAQMQVQTRSIQMSDSRLSATGVKYKVTFTAQQAAQSLVIDFCQASPIIAATCDTVNGVTFTGATLTNGNLPADWSTFTATASTVKIGGTTGLTPSTSYNFTINGVNNPTGYWNGTSDVAGTPGSFYARIYTFANGTYGTYTNSGTPGNYVDYGGFALSTTNAITISATVMETLTFCTSGLVAAAAPTSCASTSTPAVTLGSGTPPTIDSNSVYDNSTGTYRTYMVLSTNAVSGAVVNMKSGWTCNGLSANSGTSCGIPGQASNLAAGTAGFGMKVAAGTGGTGAITPTGSYNTSTFYMGAGATGPYGDPIAQTGVSPAPCSNVVSQLTFGATAGLTTPAGIYTANENLIATGTF
jgi:hypothetical protein